MSSTNVYVNMKIIKKHKTTRECSYNITRTLSANYNLDFLHKIASGRNKIFYLSLLQGDRTQQMLRPLAF